MSESTLRVFQFIEGGARYGAAVSVISVAEGMRRLGIDVEFGVFAGRELGGVLRDRGFVVHEIPARKRFDARGLRYLTRFLRERQFDLIHTHLSKATILGCLAAKWSRTPAVATVHGMNKKYTYMLADHLMTVSEAAKRHLVGQGIPASRITAVYNGISVEPFDGAPAPALAKRDFGFDENAFVAGTVSRAHKQKGVELAIGAVAELRARGLDAKYLFVGDGPHIEEFKERAGALGLADHVRFPGFSDSIVPALSAMDVFMFPTFREAFGISLLEAMAARVPVIASNVDGVPEVLAEGSGILIDNPTAGTLAEAAQSLHDDPELRADLVGRARTRVETAFSLESVARSVQGVYLRAVAQAAPRGRRSLPESPLG